MNWIGVLRKTPKEYWKRKKQQKRIGHRQTINHVLEARKDPGGGTGVFCIFLFQQKIKDIFVDDSIQ